ncbi:MAG: hypothetical protein P1V20_03005 [Verrucomicrobiales bacterium]|nr:hypothetical protein [Verrucomicrobiales bacterium]
MAKAKPSGNRNSGGRPTSWPTGRRILYWRSVGISGQRSDHLQHLSIVIKIGYHILTEIGGFYN